MELRLLTITGRRLAMRPRLPPVLPVTARTIGAMPTAWPSVPAAILSQQEGRMAKRMIDHLLADGALKLDVRTRTYHPWDLPELVASDRHPYLSDAEVFVLDNVTRYLYEGVPKEAWGVEDFPHCSPPGPVFWMETRPPRWI